MIVIVGRRRFPADAEQRMAGFTELVGTAIANAESRAQLEESRDEVHRLADEQAALRRVATLVARGVAPMEVFAAVVEEVAGGWLRDLLGIPSNATTGFIRTTHPGPRTSPRSCRRPKVPWWPSPIS